MTYLLTDAQRANFLQIMQNNQHDPDAYYAINELKTLPILLEEEPVAWLGHDSITTFGHMTYGFIDRRDRAIPDSWIPLYTRPATFTPISAEDVTDEVVLAWKLSLAESYEPAKDIAAAVNAFMPTYTGAKK